jgi:hypothetical protein
MEISQDVGHRPLVFIRFNPDDYKKKDGKNVLSCWKILKTGEVWNDAMILTPEEAKRFGTWLLESATIDGEEVGSSYKIQFTSVQRAKFYYQNPTSNSKTNKFSKLPLPLLNLFHRQRHFTESYINKY